MTDSKPNEPTADEKPAATKTPVVNKAEISSSPAAREAPVNEGASSTSQASAPSADKASTEALVQNQIKKIQTAQKQKNSGKGLSLFAVLLSLAALAGTGFTWYQNQVVRVQEESKLSLGVSEIGGQVSRLGDSISRIQRGQAKVVTQSELTTKVLQLATSVNSEVENLKEGQAALAESIGKINTDLQKGVNQYVVDEVSQLLRLANNSVLFARDPDSAINALSLADNQLKSLSDPRYAAVRRIINQEITELRSFQPVDVEGLSATIYSISESIPSLPLANEPEAKDAAVPEVPAQTPVTWRTELKKLWRDILSSVQIQRVDQPPKPLLVPQQRYFLNQNLQLMLAKAELALMQGEAAVSNRSIMTSIKWLNDYFDLSDARVSSVLMQLREVSAQSVGGEMPSITGSYEALQNIKGGS